MAGSLCLKGSQIFLMLAINKQLCQKLVPGRELC